jgi:hypothetical protein
LVRIVASLPANLHIPRMAAGNAFADVSQGFSKACGAIPSRLADWHQRSRVRKVVLRLSPSPLVRSGAHFDVEGQVVARSAKCHIAQ